MLFNFLFISSLCLFVVTFVGAQRVVPGQIVEVRSTSLMLYYHKALNLRENSYRLAVYVRTAKSNGALLVVPVVPKDAPENIFPLHLRGDVKQYFGGEHPKIEGLGTSVLEGDFFDLSVYHGVKQDDIKTTKSPTIMGSSDLEGMTNKIAQNLKTRGMCPIQDIAYPDPKGANAGSIERNRLNIEPAQVIYFHYLHADGPLYPAVAVCWTGQGYMAIMGILKQGVQGSQKIWASDFSTPYIRAGRHAQRTITISGEVDLTHFYFVHYVTVTDPRPAPFLKKFRFYDFVKTIAAQASSQNAGESSASNQDNRPVTEPGPSSGGTIPGPSSGVGASAQGGNKGNGGWRGGTGKGKGRDI